MLAISVNDKPLEVSAIVEQGRVLLPMRATFAALGATISYDPSSQVVVARSVSHSLRLPIGKRTALVDGQRITLDVPARVIAGRTYVPLRFVATAMGASVGYDASAQIVNVTSQEAISALGERVHVTALNPPEGATVSTAYPTVSASLSEENAKRGDVTLSIDGEDVSALATFDGSTITFMPRNGLSRGAHRVVFAGRTVNGHDFSTQWSFDTTLAAPPDASAGMYSGYDYRFYLNGLNTFYPGDFMRFTLIAPPGGSAVLQLCNLGYQYPFWNGGYGGIYQATVLAPYGYWLPACEVTAIYTSWSGVRTYVPIPVYVGLYTNPIAAPPGRPLPRSPRRPEPTPQPAPVVLPTPHHVAPTPVPAPIAAPPPRPIRGPIPLPPRPRPSP